MQKNGFNNNESFDSLPDDDIRRRGRSAQTQSNHNQPASSLFATPATTPAPFNDRQLRREDSAFDRPHSQNNFDSVPPQHHNRHPLLYTSSKQTVTSTPEGFTDAPFGESNLVVRNGPNQLRSLSEGNQSQYNKYNGTRTQPTRNGNHNNINSSSSQFTLMSPDNDANRDHHHILPNSFNSKREMDSVKMGASPSDEEVEVTAATAINMQNKATHEVAEIGYIPPRIQGTAVAPPLMKTEVASPSLFFNNGKASSLHAFGNSRPACAGKFLFAKDFTSSAVIFVLNVTFTALFVYSWFDYGIKSNSQSTSYGYENCNGNFQMYLLPAVAQIVISCISLFAMFATVTTNPGVLLKQVGKNARNHKPPPGHIDFIELNGIQVLMPYCDTCNIVRPPRSSHCIKCNNCVDTFDHHCGMIGACVGKRNFRLFIIFLYSTILMALWGIIWSIILAWIIFPTTDTVNKVFAIAVAIASTLTLCMLSFMGTHYCKLIRRGFTQREYIKKEKLYPAGKNPYDDGCIKNWKEVCFW